MTAVAYTVTSPVDGEPRLDAKQFVSDTGQTATIRRRRKGAAIDVAPWVIEIAMEGQNRFSFRRSEIDATGAALEILGLLAEATHLRERADVVATAAEAVLTADAFA